MDAQEQARERDQFLTKMLDTVSNPTYHHQGKMPCDEGTRAEILSEIREWIRDTSNNSQGFLWLSGDPGSGKSAITASIARDCRDEGTLWAQFFINRNNVETTDPRLYFPSIARQFIDRSSQSQSEVGTMIYSAIQKRPTLLDRISGAQASALFVDVIEAACHIDSDKSVVVVIDGLDETSASQLAATAEIFSQIFSSLTSRNAKVLISSRTDDDIRRPFAKMMDPKHVKHIHLDTSEPSSIRDVSVYLARRISSIVTQHDLNWNQWPGQERMEMLCDRASGLFIWAVTVAKFFQDQIKVFGTECLQDLLDTFSHNGMGDINALYCTILRLAYQSQNDPWAYETFRRVVGCIVTLQEPLSIAAIKDLLDLRRHPSSSPVDILNFCRQLRTVLISGAEAIDKHTVPRLHKSFFEFIISNHVEEKFRIDIRLSNGELALQSIRQLTEFSLQHDINELPDEAAPEMRYAMQFWGSHLQTENVTSGLCFASNDLVHIRAELNSLFQAGDYNPLNIVIPPARKDIVLSSGRKLKLWQEKNPTDIKQSLSDIKQPSAIAFSPGRQMVALCDSKHIMHILNIQTGEAVVPPCVKHTGTVYAIAFSPDGLHLASGGNDRTFRVWRLRTALELRFSSTSTGRILCVAFAPDGRHAAACGIEQPIHIFSFDGLSGRDIGPKGEEGSYRMIAFSPEGDMLAAVNIDSGACTVWDTQNGTCLHSLQPENGTFCCVVFPRLGGYIASFESSQGVRLWDASSGALARNFDASTGRIVRAEFSPDGESIVGTTFFGRVDVWNVKTGRLVGPTVESMDDDPMATLDPPAVLAAALSMDGRQIMIGKSDGTIVGKAIVTPAKIESTLSSITMSSDAILSASSDHNLIQYWDVDTMLPMEIALIGDTSQNFAIVAMAPDETRIAALSMANSVTLWDAKTRQPVCAPITPTMEGIHPSLSLEFSADSSLVTLASIDGSLCTWNAIDGSPMTALPSPPLSEVGECFDLRRGWIETPPLAVKPNRRTITYEDNRIDRMYWYPGMHTAGGLWAYSEGKLIRSNGPGSLTILDTRPLNDRLTISRMRSDEIKKRQRID